MAGLGGDLSAGFLFAGLLGTREDDTRLHAFAQRQVLDQDRRAIRATLYHLTSARLHDDNTRLAERRLVGLMASLRGKLREALLGAAHRAF